MPTKPTTKTGFNIAAAVLSGLAGAIAAFLLNYFLIERLLIPDPCYYHGHEPSALFSLFYDLPAFEGGHPFPTLLNLVTTLVGGAAIGIALWATWIKKRTKRKAATIGL